jgi:hypothetical protein
VFLRASIYIPKIRRGASLFWVKSVKKYQKTIEKAGNVKRGIWN